MKPQILYVDDEHFNLLMFKANFRMDFDVITALDGVSGLTKLELNSEISVVVSDLHMAKMNGMEFVKQAKLKYPDKKFFILTGFEITEEVKEALNTGLIEQYLSKPYDIERMHDIIVDSIKE